MSGCVLRVFGEEFAVDVFLEQSTFEPCAVWRKGETRFKSSGKREETSGFNVFVGGDDFEQQVRDASRFVTRNAASLGYLASRSDVAVALDFGVHHDVDGDIIWPSYRLKPDFTKVCGDLGIEIAISVYLRSSREAE